MTAATKPVLAAALANHLALISSANVQVVVYQHCGLTAH